MSKEEIIEIILNNPNYSKEKLFKKHFLKQYQEILNIEFPISFIFKQKIYHYLYNDNELNLGICKKCGKRTRYKGFSYGYSTYCSIKCAQNDEEIQDKIAKNNLEKYGNTCSLHGKEIIDKKKKTWIEHYGVDNPAKAKEVQNKTKTTCLEKYGVEHVLQNDTVRSKSKETMLERYGVKYALQSNELREKMKKTNIEKYGVEYASQSDEIKNKVKKTNIERYGVDNPMKSEQVKEKSRKTCLEKYDVEYSLQAKEVREKINKTNFKKYGVSYTFQANEIKEKIKQSCLEKYGVPWACMRNEARNHTNNSKPNLFFAELLKQNNIQYEREYRLNNSSFDFKVNDILIEINPTITHNSFLNIYNGEPLSIDYHLKKSNLAKEHGFHCIHVWDWDNIDKIIQMLKSKKTLYARNLNIKEVIKKENDAFLNSHHIQNTCNGQTIRLGLYLNDELIQVMTFGKPRYNKKFEYELLRLCTNSDYIVVGGAEKLFKYFIKQYCPKSIISYCDYSKFSGDVYVKLGFELKKDFAPSKHWCRKNDKKHITDNLLRQRGYDQLFDTNYGKGTSNEELMLEHGFLPIYDCGQMTWVYKY